MQLRYVLFSAYAFMVIYKISFLSIPSLSSARLGVLGGLLALPFFRRAIKYHTKAYWLFLLLPYAGLQYLTVGEADLVSRYLNLFTNSIVASILFAYFVRDCDLGLKILLGAVSVQAVCMLVIFPSYDIRAWLDQTIVIGSHFEASSTIRGVGFSSVAGAHLSVVQSLGVLLGGSLLASNPGLASRKKILVIFAMVLCGTSAAISGRTGLLMSLCFVMLYFSVLKVWFYRDLVVFLMVTALSIALFSLVNGLLQDFFGERAIQWMFRIFTGQDRTVESLIGMGAPPISIETIVGSGRLTSDYGGNYTGSDSGYIQMYAALGLIFTALFYFVLSWVLFHVLCFLPLTGRLAVCCLFLLIELKEPFLFKQSYFFIIHAVYLCSKYYTTRCDMWADSTDEQVMKVKGV